MATIPYVSAARLVPVALLLILAAAPAQASDSKVLPSTMCQVWVPFDASASTVASLRNSVRYSVNGRLENWSTSSSITVVCPIERDSAASPLDWLRVYFSDGYAGSGVGGNGILRCRLRANNAHGDAAVAEDYDDSEGVDAADGDFEMELDDEATDGNYTLTCTIPPLRLGVPSAIGSIRYQEAQ